MSEEGHFIFLFGPCFGTVAIDEAYVQVVTCTEERVETHFFVPNNFRKILFSNDKLKEKDCAFFGIPVVKQANN